jgi:surface polysaccharide O-acyltransferase-like enzyme
MARTLSYLNGLATLGVVLYHASGWGFVAMFWWTHRYLPVSVPDFSQMFGLSYFGLRLIEQLVIVSIPAFLLVSGFFVAFAAGRSQATVPWGTVWTRIRHLAIPFLLWSGVMLVAAILQGETYSPGEAFLQVVLGRTTPAFYFVPLLCQLYLLVPVLVPWARRNWKSLLLSAAVLQSLVHVIRYLMILGLPLPGGGLVPALTQGWFFPSNVFWFALGIVAGFRHQGVVTWFVRFRRAVVATALLLIPLGMIEWEMLLRGSGRAWIGPEETLLDNVFSLAVLLTFLAYTGSRLPFARAAADLGGRSYGVYLVHSLVLMGVAKAIYHGAPWVLGRQWLFQPILIGAGLAVPLLFMAAVKHSPARWTYELQFG